MIYTSKITLDTSSDLEIIDITEQIKEVIQKSGISNGVINIQSMHTTGSIIVNEYESGLKRDYIKVIRDIIPKIHYEHDLIDNNARSHLMAFLSNTSCTLNFVDKKLSLGTWQSVFFVEYDGPRLNRKISIMIMGE